MPFLSIIIAALKIDTALKTTLNSLFDQHFQDIEIIIQGLDENSSSCLEFQSVHDWKGRLLFLEKKILEFTMPLIRLYNTVTENGLFFLDLAIFV